MQEMIDEMKKKEGKEFDHAFMDAMIIHHKQAVEMTELAFKKAENPELRQMAEEMNEKQQAEIDRMEEMRSR